MMRKTGALLLLCAVFCLCFPPDASAAAGFSDVGSYTDTKNQYYFDTDEVVLVYNNEAETDPDYDKIWAGSDLYVPVYVYPDRSNQEEIATDKLIKSDSVTVSAKVTHGAQYIGDVTLVDGKKRKLDDLPAGIYARIPFTGDYANLGKTSVTMRLVLLVNGLSYQETRVTLNCTLQNRVENIITNSVFSAKKPAQFKAGKGYNGDAAFDFGDNIRYTARVTAGKSYYLNLQRTPNKAIADMYPDAHLEFYNFMGKEDSFASSGKLEIPVKRDQFKDKNGAASIFAYRVDGDNLTALEKGDITFNSKTDKLTIYTDSLESYVLSNQALMKTVNPNNDNILKSGYAQTASGQITESSDTAEPGTSGNTNTKNSGASSSAPAPAQSAAENVPTPTAAAASNANDNVGTGLSISAGNKSADNPSTADISLLPLAFSGLLCGAVLPLARKLTDSRAKN